MKYSAYWRLMRLDKPVGIILLWLPTAWALWIANGGTPNIRLIIYFFCGTILMRSAGCVINDIADRHIDRHVSRTRLRPLTTGEIQLPQALLLLLLLLVGALSIVLQLPSACFYYGIAAVGITVLYPFCKRFFQAPQLVLGVAFSMGIPMAYVASGVKMTEMTLILWSLNFVWIVAYDTLYAMVDRPDDLRIGVKSTAILFAHYDRKIIAFLQLACHSLWLWLAIGLHFQSFFYVCWAIAFFNLCYQQYLMSLQTPDAYFKAFFSNTWYGGWLWLGLILQAASS